MIYNANHQTNTMNHSKQLLSNTNLESLERLQKFLCDRCFGVIKSNSNSEIESEIRRAGFGFLLMKDLAETNECKGYLVIGADNQLGAGLRSFLAKYNGEYFTKVDELLYKCNASFHTPIVFFCRRQNLF